MPIVYARTPTAIVALVVATLTLTACGASNPAGTSPTGQTLNTQSCNGLPGPCSTSLTAIPLTGCAVSDYTIPVTVGSQTFNLTLDSGSSTLAIAASTCTTCGVSPEYTPGSNATDTNQTTSADYGGGEGWVGTVYDDTVNMATGVSSVTMDIVSITAETIQQRGAQPFFSPSYCSGNAVANDDQGILGLGGPGAGATHTDPFMVKLAGTSTLPVFSVQMCDLNGTAWFGGYDPTSISTEPQFTPLVDANNYYVVDLADIQLAGTSLGVSSANTGTTIMDTGTSIIVLNATAFDKVTAAIQANNSFANLFGNTFLTDTNQGCVLAPNNLSATQLNNELPTFSLVFPGVGGGKIQVELPATESYLTPVLGSDGHTVGYCPALVSQPNSSPGIVIGNSAMHTSITIFDRQNMQIGFAKAANCKAIGG